MLVPSYKPLKRTLVERGMTAAELRHLADIAPNTFTKINKNDWIALKIIAKICEALNCRVQDVIEFVDDGAN